MLVGIAGIEADLKDANLGGARLNEADLSVFRHGLPANYPPDFANAMWLWGSLPECSPLAPRVLWRGLRWHRAGKRACSSAVCRG